MPASGCHFLPLACRSAFSWRTCSNISAGIGYQAFSPKYLFYTPEALIYNAAGSLIAPVINKKAIQADYLSANAKQLQSVYNYQRVILNAFTEVITRVSMVENYTKSIEVKKQRLKSLEASVDVASKLFQAARVEYVEVLLAQRDLLEARVVLIETKKQQLSAIVNAYQALGGGDPAKFPDKHQLCANGTAHQGLVPGEKVQVAEKVRTEPKPELKAALPDSRRLELLPE